MPQVQFKVIHLKTNEHSKLLSEFLPSNQLNVSLSIYLWNINNKNFPCKCKRNQTFCY